MSFNTILAPIKISPGNSDSFDFPAITSLSNGSFAVTYDVIDYVDVTQIVSEVFNGQGQLVQETFATPLPHGLEDDPDVAGLSGGGYALAWERLVDVGGHLAPEIYTAVYDNQGNPLSVPVGVDADPGLDNPAVPQVTALPAGGYVVTWMIGLPTGASDIVAAIYNSAGQEVVAPINVTNSPGVNDVLSGLGNSVAALANGSFALTWRTGNQDIYTAIYDAQGQQVLAPFNVTLNSAIGAGNSEIAALSNGNYALFWEGGLFTAVFDAQGNQIAAPAVVGPGNTPAIAALTNGNYALSWDDGLDIFTAVYNAQGQQVVAPVNITNDPGNGDFDVEVTALPNGAYALTWEHLLSDGVDIFTAVYGAQGQQLVAPQNVSNSPGVNDDSARVAAQANGSYAITWHGPGTILSAEYLAIFQYVPDSDSVSVVGSPDINIDLSAIVNVGGDVIVRDNGNAVSIDLHNLASVGGNFVLSNNGALLTITLPSLTSVGGNLDISGNTSATVINAGGLSTVSGNLDISGDTSATAINAGGLTTVGGNLTIDNDTAATVINAGSLASVSGNLDISGDTSATAIDAGGLTTVGGNLTVDNDTAATVINAGSLATVGGNLDLTGNTTVVTIDLSALIQAGAIVISNNGVVTLNLSALVKAGGDVSITNNHSLLTIDMPDLAEVDGDLTISGNTSATVIDAAALVTVGGNVTIDLSLDATVDASALGPGGGSVHVIGDDGHETTVLLGSLAQMQGTLTITSADGVTLTSAAGLGTITLTGTAAGNTLIGSATAANIINAGAGNDTATGGGSTDRITGGAGDDLLDGQGGVDTAVYSGNRADYHVVRNADGSLTISDMRANAPDGSDTLRHFELFQFADGVRTLAELLPAVAITSNGGGDSAQASVAENTTVVAQVTATNPNAVAHLDFTIAGGADAAKFHIDQATGALSFIAAPDFEHPTDSGGNDVYDVIVKVSDSFDFDTQALAIAVTDVNEPPVVSALTGSVGEDGPAFSQNLLAGASDPDAGTQLSVSALDATVTTSGGRVLVLGTDYTLNGSTLALTSSQGFAKFNSLAAAQSDQAVVHFGVSDGLIVTPNALTLTVTGADDAPTLVNQTADQSATAGTPFSLILPAGTFQDPDSGDHLTLAATLSNGAALPAWLNFNAATGAFSGTPGSGDAGGFDIKVTATDTGSLTAADVFHVSVSAPGTNHAPVITSDLGGATASVIITDDTRYVATVHASDPDPGTTISYSIIGGADQKLFAIDPHTGLLSFKTMPHEGHSYQVKVAASDGSLQDTQAINVQVASGPFKSGNADVADTFAFKPHFGLAVVSNFDAASASHDVLELDHALFRNADPNSSPAAIFDLIEHHSFQFGHDVIIVTDTHDIIDLRNANLHNLTAQDFLLV